MAEEPSCPRREHTISANDIEEGAGDIEPRADLANTVDVELRRFENQWGEYEIVYEMPEFKLLCPMGGHKEQAHLTIRIIPDEYLLEGASLRAYLRSWSNVKVWNEAVTSIIRDDIEEAIRPKECEVTLEVEADGNIYTTINANIKEHKRTD